MKILLIYLLFMSLSFGSEAQADKEDVTYPGGVLSITKGNKLFFGDDIPAEYSEYDKKLKYYYIGSMYNLDSLSGNDDRLIGLQKKYETHRKVGANIAMIFNIHLFLSALNILPPEFAAFKWGPKETIIHALTAFGGAYYFVYRQKNILNEYVETYNGKPKLSLNYNWRF